MVYTDLHRAASNGDIVLVNRLMKTEPYSMVALDSNKFMPVHWAAWEGHTEVAEALATNMPLAVLTTARTRKGLTAFETAVKWGNQETGDVISTVVAVRRPAIRARVTSPLRVAGPSRQEKTAAILMIRMRHAQAAAAAAAKRDVVQAAVEAEQAAAEAAVEAVVAAKSHPRSIIPGGRSRHAYSPRDVQLSITPNTATTTTAVVTATANATDSTTTDTTADTSSTSSTTSTTTPLAAGTAATITAAMENDDGFVGRSAAVDAPPKTPLNQASAMWTPFDSPGTPPVKMWEQQQAALKPIPPQHYSFEYVSSEGARTVAAVLVASSSSSSSNKSSSNASSSVGGGGGAAAAAAAAVTMPEASVVLSTSAITAVVELFDAIDRNNDGTLTVEDFDELTTDPDFGAEGWTKLQSRFDLDGDGLVTMAEFICVLKGLALRKVLVSDLEFTAPARWTLTQWCRELNDVLSTAVEDECARLRGWFEQYDGTKSAMRGATTAADRAEQSQHALVATIGMGTESTAQMETLFHVVDTHSRGVVEAADFATMSKNPATSCWWREIKLNFDGFATEKLVSSEFTARIVGAVHNRVAVGMQPAETTTWGELVAMLREWSDWRAQTLCLSIFDAKLHGEYGEEVDAPTQELRDTFGPHEALSFDIL